MKRTSARVVLLGMGLLLLTAGPPLTAGDKDKKGAGLPDFPPPGPEHAQLKELAGTFDAQVTMHFEGGKTADSKGMMKRQMILDGRFLQEDYDGTFGGKPFKGVGISGYDPSKKKYVSIWADSVSNALMVSEGTYDAKTKTYTYTGEEVDPTTGKKYKTRDVVKVLSPDEQTMEMYRTADGGKETKVLDIRYTRKK
jgi:hypothetical protein